MQLTAKLLRSLDGIEIYAEAAGDPAKPAIVFIHGFCSSGLVFDGIFEDPEWNTNFYLVRYDTRGHGRSSKPTYVDAWRSKKLSDDFDAVVSAFDLKRPFVAAWSIGATHIPDILSFHEPAFLRGIINIAGVPYKSSIFPTGDSPGTGLPYSLGILPPLIAPPSVEVYREAAFALLEGMTTSFTFKDRQASLGSILCVPPSSIATMMARTQDEKALRTYGDKLDMMVIYGTKDKLINVPEVVRLLRVNVKWERLHVVVMEGVDHAPWIVDPEQFRNGVQTWIRGILEKET